MRATVGVASPRLVIIAEFRVKQECVEECERVLCESARGSRAEPGCVRFDVLRDQTDPCRRVSNMLAWLGLAPPLAVATCACACSHSTTAGRRMRRAASRHSTATRLSHLHACDGRHVRGLHIACTCICTCTCICMCVRRIVTYEAFLTASDMESHKEQPHVKVHRSIDRSIDRDS